jgi:methyl-accepting chemotaxis protein
MSRENNAQDFKDELNLITDKLSADLLDQFPSYNYSSTEDFINDLEEELSEQNTLNSLLKNNDVHNNMDSLNEFINEYGEKVNDQVLRLKEFNSRLKEVVTENRQLKDGLENYTSIADTVDYKELANNMRELKTLKKNVRHFLETQGIVHSISSAT